jgi:hypothetical protein
MCAIIIAASKLRLMDVTWFNPLSKDAEDVSSDDMKVLYEKIVASIIVACRHTKGPGTGVASPYGTV